MLTYAAAGVVAGALALTVAPSFAASNTTEIYLANVRLEVDFLAGSAKIAAQNAQGDGLKTFAAGELRHQGDVLAALDGWRAHEEGATPSETASLSTEPQTGRSVSDSTVDVNKFAPPPGIGVLMPAAAITLDHLSSLKGEAFASTFKATQVMALKRLAGFYEAYSMTGDNAALREMATGELAEVRAELVAIDKA